MRTIAYITCKEKPDLTRSDRLTVPLLEKHGVQVQAVPWDTPDTYWQKFDAVVLRSPWDYHHRYDEFMRWLESLDGVKLFNPAEIVRWNSNKVYLRELAERGIPIVPAVWLEPESDLAGILREKQWEKAVIKPTISASAYGTWVLTPEQTHQERLKHFDVPMMLQPFMPQIISEGEWSFLFFGGKFSHAVLKRPQPGDFRVQSDFNGIVETPPPPPELIGQAQRVVEMVQMPLLYARVDGINVDSIFHLMELELIEPELFLPYHPDAAQHFVDALLAVSNLI